jgi:hypothetical protein
VIAVTGSPLANLPQIAKDDGYIRGCRQATRPLQPMVSRLLHLMVIDICGACVALRIGVKLQPLKEMKTT